MHGKPSMQKKMRKARRFQSRQPSRGSYLEVGAWRLKENDEGDLVIIDTETGKTVTLINK